MRHLKSRPKQTEHAQFINSLYPTSVMGAAALDYVLEVGAVLSRDDGIFSDAYERLHVENSSSTDSGSYESYSDASFLSESSFDSLASFIDEEGTPTMDFFIDDDEESLPPAIEDFRDALRDMPDLPGPSVLPPARNPALLAATLLQHIAAFQRAMQQHPDVFPGEGRKYGSDDPAPSLFGQDYVDQFTVVSLLCGAIATGPALALPGVFWDTLLADDGANGLMLFQLLHTLTLSSVATVIAAVEATPASPAPLLFHLTPLNPDFALCCAALVRFLTAAHGDLAARGGGEGGRWAVDRVRDTLAALLTALIVLHDPVATAWVTNPPRRLGDEWAGLEVNLLGYLEVCDTDPLICLVLVFLSYPQSIDTGAESPDIVIFRRHCLNELLRKASPSSALQSFWGLAPRLVPGLAQYLPPDLRQIHHNIWNIDKISLSSAMTRYQAGFDRETVPAIGVTRHGTFLAAASLHLHGSAGATDRALMAYQMALDGRGGSSVRCAPAVVSGVLLCGPTESQRAACRVVWDGTRTIRECTQHLIMADAAVDAWPGREAALDQDLASVDPCPLVVSRDGKEKQEHLMPAYWSEFSALVREILPLSTVLESGPTQDAVQEVEVRRTKRRG
ncbi:hypothetical protein J8273_3629 [Carpediemonas membranifera]|uniref:Uncharacterized protein n=1 Tax=Carpediemonas membranifera TaxID=201153 RepID=A0A8J6E4L9_9EUKA|nr:hypothetical protein J8273_3629 [Carpediemonas membranifera]|eukprot:KAG9394657.1 hypothetical protein J8273_3629 [Carpediemonas membranifera]